MTKTAFDSDAARGGSAEAVTLDSLLFLATSAFGLAMLALLGVLALADVVGVASILPFLALPPVLFIASGVLLWRWTSGREHAGTT
jgi:glycerol-3-phosphate acyltransferase PlsY